MPGKQAARLTDKTTHASFPLGPGPGSLTVIIGNLPAWRANVDQHACPEVDPSTGRIDGMGHVLVGSPTVFIEHQMACRMGDVVVETPGLVMGPSNPIAEGCESVFIGDSGGAGGSQGVTMSTARRAGVPFTKTDCDGC